MSASNRCDCATSRCDSVGPHNVSGSCPPVVLRRYSVVHAAIARENRGDGWLWGCEDANVTTAWLDQLTDLEKTPTALPYGDREYDLDGFRRRLANLGNPQDASHFVHVAGTKGKGSTVAFLESLFLAMGWRTAAFVSPHLESLADRFRFDRRPWSTPEFEKRLESLGDALDAELQPKSFTDRPFRTVFEILTTLALVEFGRREQALRADVGDPRPRQIVCWETGLGGRLDCTNVVTPLVSVIAPIGRDHTRILGDTISQIATEKAGIIKPGGLVVVARQPEEYREDIHRVIEARTAEQGARVVRAEELCRVEHIRPAATGQRIRVRLPNGASHEAELPMHGAFQCINLEAALAAAWLVAERFAVEVSDEAIWESLAHTYWPGRLEIVKSKDNRTLVIDGAHCPLSASAVGSTLAEWEAMAEPPCRGPYTLLWAMQQDKDHEAFLKSLYAPLDSQLIDSVHTFPTGSQMRTAAPEDLERIASGFGLDAATHPDAASAVAAAKGNGTALLSLGTLYTIAVVRERFLAGG